MNLRSRIRSLKKRVLKRETLITVGISRECLLQNFSTYRRRYPDQLLAPVLKSNAYGHGLTLVAEILDREPIAFFMLDSLYEARKLRHAGIRSRILVMGYVRPKEIARNRLSKIDFAIVDIEQLRELTKIAGSETRVHLKIDTGMCRQGLLLSELDNAILLIQQNQSLHVVGVATHLGDADNPESVMTDRQLTRWHEALARIEETFPLIEFRHVAATKGARFATETKSNVIRLGLGLYGFDTSPEMRDVQPVLELRSIVAMLRTVSAQEFVGYNATHTTEAETTLATVPIGYHEGIDRRLSGKGTYLVSGLPAPIVGRVSMNMSSVDVTGIKNVKQGDEVVAISRDHEAPNSLRKLALLAETTPYVLLAHIPEHLRRVVE